MQMTEYEYDVDEVRAICAFVVDRLKDVPEDRVAAELEDALLEWEEERAAVAASRPLYQ